MAFGKWAVGFGDGLNVREWAVARKVTSGTQKGTVLKLTTVQFMNKLTV